MNTILIKPLVTEKAMDATKRSYYSFLVAATASKYHIKQAVEALFSVSVEGVRTITRKGKAKRVGKMRQEVMMANTKKAIVKLKKGQTIDIVPTAPEEEKA
jgi:large subunit ribosomal protein L23